MDSPHFSSNSPAIFDDSEEGILGPVVPIEQQRRALDPGSSIIDSPERNAGDVLFVLEKRAENLDVFVRKPFLRFRRLLRSDRS